MPLVKFKWVKSYYNINIKKISFQQKKLVFIYFKIYIGHNVFDFLKTRKLKRIFDYYFQ